MDNNDVFNGESQELWEKILSEDPELETTLAAMDEEERDDYLNSWCLQQMFRFWLMLHARSV